MHMNKKQTPWYPHVVQRKKKSSIINGTIMYSFASKLFFSRWDSWGSSKLLHTLVIIFTVEYTIIYYPFLWDDDGH